MDHPCRCIARALAAPASPLRYDERLNEYHLVWESDDKTRRTMIVRYCPFCAIRMPESKRGELFHTVSEDEAAAVRLRIGGATTEAEIVAALGPPDRVLELDQIHGGTWWEGFEAPAFKTVKQLDWLNLGRTIVFTLQVDADGKIQWIFGPKPK
ncbi:MAG: hypothetical protein HYY17_06685 [Planctomycetes bacterium]|nr:hypothetical protein [Planctomycetota bacterium]